MVAVIPALILFTISAKVAETGQIAERNETERVLALIAMEGAEMLQQTIAGLFDAAYLVVALSLRVDVAQLRVNLSM